MQGKLLHNVESNHQNNRGAIKGKYEQVLERKKGSMYN